ncbi:MAG: FkbM family methyltransferase [bacterium]
MSLASLYQRGRKYLPFAIRRQVALWRLSEINEFAVVYHSLGRRTGIMLDVGAAHGSCHQMYAGDGWTVHAFEPDPRTADELSRRDAQQPSVHVECCAVSDMSSRRVPFYRSPVSPGLTSLTPFTTEHELAGYVATVTLAEFARERGITTVDFLKIDAEGFDLMVLKGNDWDLLRPDVIQCEFEDRKTVPLGYAFDDLARYLTDRGYSVLVSEWYPIEKYGEWPRWRKFQTYPCRLTDVHACGNLIACKDGELFSQLLQTAGQFAERYHRVMVSR